MKPVRVRRGFGFLVQALVALALGACSSLPGLPWLSQPTLAPPATPSPSPQDQASPTSPAPQATQPAPSSITIWLPPEFNPTTGTAAGKLLRSRLDAFGAANGVQVSARVKVSTGPGGLLDALNAASAAAPLSLPGVIALPQSDLETAAVKGLIIPLDGANSALNSPDWYDYAHQLALVQGVSFGLPFAGDALLTVYRPAKIASPPVSWDAILHLGQPLAFAAGSQQALVTILLYQANGGQIEDAQRRPVLQVDPLGQILTLYRQAADRAIFPTWIAQFDNDSQVWQAYQDGRVNAALTWSTYFLASRPSDSAILAFPAPDSKAASLATGWVWAVSDPLHDRRELSIRLAEWLVDPAFLAEWTAAAGYLPTRPSSLTAWRDSNLRGQLNIIAAAARLRPSTDLLVGLGPTLHEATVNVLRLQAEPLPAAATAAAHLSSTPSP